METKSELKVGDRCVVIDDGNIRGSAERFIGMQVDIIGRPTMLDMLMGGPHMEWNVRFGNKTFSCTASVLRKVDKMEQTKLTETLPWATCFWAPDAEMIIPDNVTDPDA